MLYIRSTISYFCSISYNCDIHFTTKPVLLQCDEKQFSFSVWIDVLSRRLIFYWKLWVVIFDHLWTFKFYVCSKHNPVPPAACLSLKFKCGMFLTKLKTFDCWLGYRQWIKLSSGNIFSWDFEHRKFVWNLFIFFVCWASRKYIIKICGPWTWTLMYGVKT